MRLSARLVAALAGVSAFLSALPAVSSAQVAPARAQSREVLQPGERVQPAQAKQTSVLRPKSQRNCLPNTDTSQRFRLEGVEVSSSVKVKDVWRGYVDQDVSATTAHSSNTAGTIRFTKRCEVIVRPPRLACRSANRRT